MRKEGIREKGGEQERRKEMGMGCLAIEWSRL